MPNYRRAIAPGGTFFFTQVTFHRSPFLCDDLARTVLHAALAECRERWPFDIDAIVLLPDHFHTIWTLPPGDSAYSRRIGWLKKTFTQRYLAAGGSELQVSEGKHRDGRRGVWQPKFWEHTLTDQDDYNEHANYIHYNPVKHGLVQCPHHWPYSSFHRWVERGVYDTNWQCTCTPRCPAQPDLRACSHPKATPPTFQRLSLNDME